MVKIEKVMSSYYHGLDVKILEAVGERDDEVFTTRELANLCGSGTMKTAETARYLSRMDKIGRVKVKNSTYYGSHSSVSKLNDLMERTREGSHMKKWRIDKAKEIETKATNLQKEVKNG
jgi:hypothetical protein